MKIIARIVLVIILMFYILIKIASNGTKQKVIKQWEFIKVAVLIALLYMGGFFGDPIWE